MKISNYDDQSDAIEHTSLIAIADRLSRYGIVDVEIDHLQAKKGIWPFRRKVDYYAVAVTGKNGHRPPFISTRDTNQIRSELATIRNVLAAITGTRTPPDGPGYTESAVRGGAELGWRHTPRTPGESLGDAVRAMKKDTP